MCFHAQLNLDRPLGGEAGIGKLVVLLSGFTVNVSVQFLWEMHTQDLAVDALCFIPAL